MFRRVVIILLALLVIATPFLARPRLAAAATPQVTTSRHYSSTAMDDYHMAKVTYTPGATNQPYIIVIHGGAWLHGSTTDMDNSADVFARNGYTVFNISYPLLNPNNEQPGLPKVDWTTQRSALFQALGWIRSTQSTWGINPDRGAIFGYSAGGHLALTLGLYGDGTSGIKAIVTASGAVSPQRIARGALGRLSTEPMTPYFNNTYYAVRVATGCSYQASLISGSSCASHWRGFTPQNYASSHDPAVLLWAGKQDMVVPYGSSGEVAYYLRQHGVDAQARYVGALGHTTATALGPGQQDYTLNFLRAHLQ